MTIELRDFQPNDLTSVYLLTQQTIDLSYTGIYPERAVDFFKRYHSKNRILERYEKGLILLAIHKEQIVATGSLVKHEISGVFVLPSMQNSGLGKMIMTGLEVRAAEKKIDEITLDISLPFRKFYESLNYVISQPYQIDVGEGQYLKYWQGKKSFSSHLL